MLSLAGFTPPDSVTRSQLPGSFSFEPPANAVSWALSSGECWTLAAACSVAQSVVVAGSAIWLPSPPWKVLPPGNGAGVGASGTAPATGTASSIAAPTRTGATIRLKPDGPATARSLASPGVRPRHPHGVIRVRLPGGR